VNGRRFGPRFQSTGLVPAAPDARSAEVGAADHRRALRGLRRTRPLHCHAAPQGARGRRSRRRPAQGPRALEPPQSPAHPRSPRPLDRRLHGPCRRRAEPAAPQPRSLTGKASAPASLYGRAPLLLGLSHTFWGALMIRVLYVLAALLFAVLAA